MTTTPQELVKSRDTRELDPKEIEFPETTFVRDIENRVFQAIVLQCLARIKGISLIEGNFIDNILGRDSVEGVKGIHAEQDEQTNSLHCKVEVNICYGISIPEKAAELQARITEDLSQYTGLHVACVHVVIKNVTHADPTQRLIDQKSNSEPTPLLSDHVDSEYTDEF